MTTAELYSILDGKFPRDFQCSWDNDGLMYCFDKEKEVKKALICLDVTLDSIAYAVQNGYDTIISHHPLIFKPITNLDFEGAVGKRLREIIRHDLTVMSFHTRLDCVAVNSCLAYTLGLKKVESLMVDGLPMGRIGVLDEEMTADEFANYVGKRLDAAVTYPRMEGLKVRRVAVLGGSGGDAVSVAVSMGADALVTGECSYNKVIDGAECGLMVVTAGHFHTEDPVCKYLLNVIKGIDGAIECGIFNSNLTVNI